MFERIMNDNVKLIKLNKKVYDNIKACVQSELILIDDVSIPVEEGDKIIRGLPSNLQEVYVVLDSGFYSATSGMKAHYQVKVEKENLNEIKKNTASINNFYGNINNSQVQQNVMNSSQNMMLNEEYKKVDELVNFILKVKEGIRELDLKYDRLEDVIRSISEMEGELKSQKPYDKTIKESLRTVRSILEGVTGSVIATGLLAQINGLF